MYFRKCYYQIFAVYEEKHKVNHVTKSHADRVLWALLASHTRTSSPELLIYLFPTHASCLSHKNVNKYFFLVLGNSNQPIEVTALYSFEGQQPGDLNFQAGDRITVISKTDSHFDWWEGKLRGRTGIFPTNYVTMN